MDKETLSNYGWVVICVLVLVVMIALATPFGDFIANAVKNTTRALFDASSNAIEVGLADTKVTLGNVEDMDWTTVNEAA